MIKINFHLIKTEWNAFYKVACSKTSDFWLTKRQQLQQQKNSYNSFSLKKLSKSYFALFSCNLWIYLDEKEEKVSKFLFFNGHASQEKKLHANISNMKKLFSSKYKTNYIIKLFFVVLK